MHKTAEAITQCRFEATDPASDEVVLFKILQVLCTHGPGASWHFLHKDFLPDGTHFLQRQARMRCWTASQQQQVGMHCMHRCCQRACGVLAATA
jgi:hypothetical protein